MEKKTLEEQYVCEILKYICKEHLMGVNRKPHPERWQEVRNIGYWIK